MPNPTIMREQIEKRIVDHITTPSGEIMDIFYGNHMVYSFYYRRHRLHSNIIGHVVYRNKTNEMNITREIDIIGASTLLHIHDLFDDIFTVARAHAT